MFVLVPGPHLSKQTAQDSTTPRQRPLSFVLFSFFFACGLLRLVLFHAVSFSGGVVFHSSIISYYRQMFFFLVSTSFAWFFSDFKKKNVSLVRWLRLGLVSFPSRFDFPFLIEKNDKNTVDSADCGPEAENRVLRAHLVVHR